MIFNPFAFGEFHTYSLLLITYYFRKRLRFEALQNFKDLEREYDMFPPGCRALCAVSGGADSMCLLHLAVSLGAERGFTVLAAHYNHRLRGAESDRDEAFVRDWCGKNGVELHVGSGDVAARAARLGQGVEETARQMRYAFLNETARSLEADRIATAHNADDNAETLLLHLVRGSGLQGLTGIAPRRGALVRPLLTTPRAEIEAYAAEHQLSYVEDSTNADTAYTRNRLRREIMPLLRELNPRLTESLSDTVRYLRSDNDYLNAQAAQACLNARWAEDDLVIEARHIAALPAAIAPRAARRLLEMMGDGDTDCSAAHLNAIVDLCRGDDPSAVTFLPGGRMAQRVYKELLLTRQADPLPPFEAVPLDLDGVTQAGDWRVECRPAVCPEDARPDGYRFWLDAAALEGGALLRPRVQGDEITLPRRCAKSVKKLFIDEKFPRYVRERVPVLARGEEVLAVAGFGAQESRLARPGGAGYELLFTPMKERMEG